MSQRIVQGRAAIVMGAAAIAVGLAWAGANVAAQAPQAPPAAPAGGRAGGAPAGQGRGGGAPAAPLTAQAAPAIDLVGNWVSVVNEDWRWRMVTPPRGDYASIPINAEGKRVADLWDPARDEAAGEQCRAYGAPGLMRGPTRLHITWLDDSTLKVESDYGMQTRLFPFRRQAPANAAPSWQGVSTAQWVISAGGRGEGRGGQRFGSMKSVTTRLKPGYLRKNGVPYSAETVVTEYFNLVTEPNGTRWFVVTTRIHDPKNLVVDYIHSTNFRREADDSSWNPAPCSLR